MQKLLPRLQGRLADWQNRQRVARLAGEVARHAQAAPGQAPVVLFNASTRITGVSLNAAFALLTGWGLRLAGAPLIQFVCRQGMYPCVLGTPRGGPNQPPDYTTPPPCAACLAQSQRLYAGADVRWMDATHLHPPALEQALQPLSAAELSDFEYPDPLPGFPGPLPLGRLVLPSIRWALRRHHLPDDEPTRYLLRQYICSAYNVARQFDTLLAETKPAAAVIFNGALYPEAAARWVALQRGVRTITHEVGFQKLSTFFTTGQATIYPLEIPDDFELTPAQNARLDAYLEKRFQGQFTMAGIQFWPEMRGLDEALVNKIAQFRQVVPVFTNVVYDTSQVHANVIFPHMFAWLEVIMDVVRAHPETLFVVRAHPDEMRPNSRKLSNESVQDWMHQVATGPGTAPVDLPNVVFIAPQEYVSSYELVQRARFVIVYNSSIGLEAALMGKVVLCGGRARYTLSPGGAGHPMVDFPQSPQALRQRAEAYLEIKGAEPPAPHPIPLEWQRNARRFLYFQLYRASLPLDDFLEVGQRQGFVQLKDFPWQALLPENSATLRILRDGILAGKPFLTPESDG